MKCRFYPVLVLSFMLLKAVIAVEEVKKNPKNSERTERQLEYISLINTLLKQSNVLSSVDGVLLAFTTMIASAVTKMKPFLMASALSYLLYVATAIIFPGPLSQFGLPTLNTTSPKLGRSDSASSNKIFDNVVAETVARSIQISPVMTVMTNVSVNVITDAMARVRILSRMMVQQMSLLQGNMVWFSRMLSNECVSRFLCRVGQFTEVNFPMASSMLRVLANNYPRMDEFAVAIVRGTSSSNCSLIYPDCRT